MEKYKQAIIVRADLKLPKGKLAAQVAHASVESVLKSNNEVIKKWVSEGQKKIVLKVENLQDLLTLFQRAKDNNLVCALIKDAGRTFLTPGTITAIAIGPYEHDEIDIITKDLKMV